jgi:hypothetical protein
LVLREHSSLAPRECKGGDSPSGLSAEKEKPAKLARLQINRRGGNIGGAEYAFNLRLGPADANGGASHFRVRRSAHGAPPPLQRTSAERSSGLFRDFLRQPLHVGAYLFSFCNRS